jgi:hypothetical protein
MFAVPWVAQAQDGKPKEELVRLHDVVRIRVVHRQPRSGGHEVFVVVASDGTVDLDKVKKGYGRVKVSRKSTRDAETAIQEHLASMDIEVKASVSILDTQEIQEEYSKQRKFVKNLPNGIAGTRARIRDLQHALANMKTNGITERPIRIDVHGALEINLQNVHPKHRKGITRLFLVSTDDWIDLDYSEGSYGRFYVVGKTADEAASLILAELRKTHPDARVSVELLSKFGIQGEITRCEQSMESIEFYLERAKLNVEELERALPLN